MAPRKLQTRYPLPAWASLHPAKDNAVLADPDKFYPKILSELGVTVEKATKFDIECAYQIMKMDLQFAVGFFGFTIHVRGDDGRKDRWQLIAFPGTAEDVKRATKGKEAREIYRTLRGFIPS